MLSCVLVNVRVWFYTSSPKPQLQANTSLGKHHKRLAEQKRQRILV